jgi:hypothetical protein
MDEFKGSFTGADGVGLTVHVMESDRIVIKTGDRRFAKPDGSRPGIRFSASSNPDSAYYDPNNFNRLAGYLRGRGLPAPDPVPEHPRRLDRRWPLLSPGLRARIRKQDRRPLS